MTGQVGVPKMGQLTLGKRPAKTGIGNYVQGATIPNKGFFFYINKLQYRMQHYNNYVQYKKKIFLAVQVKNKPCDGGSEHGFINGLDGCKQYGKWIFKTRIFTNSIFVNTKSYKLLTTPEKNNSHMYGIFCMYSVVGIQIHTLSIIFTYFLVSKLGEYGVKNLIIFSNISARFPNI